MSRNWFILDPLKRVVYPGERNTVQYAWSNAGSITEVVAAGQAPIDPDKRAEADIVALATAKKVIYKPSNGTVAFEFRIRADGTEGDELVLQLLAAAGVDRYTKVMDLTCTQGTQDADDSAKFIDAMARTNSRWLTLIRVVAAEVNYIARGVMNTHGYDRFLWVSTDLQNATNIYIDVRRF